MPMRFIQEPNAPRGMGRVVDEAAGLDRMVYDPALAEQLESSGYAESSAQQETIANAPEASSVAPPAPPVEAVAAPAAPALPGAAPPVSEPQAQAWQAANSPRPPAPIVRASGNPMPPGPAPEGTVLTKAKVEMGQPGYRYDQAAEEQRGEDLLERTMEMQRRADAADAVRREQEIALGEQKAEAQRREAEAQQKATRFESELETTVKREINQDRLQENQGFFGSILGLVGQTLGYLSTPDSGFGRLQSALERRTQRDIDAQKEAKESTINMLTKQLGSAQQAENHYRAQVFATTADILETKLQRLGVADQYADKIQGLRDNAMAYNEAAKAASYGKPGKAEYEFERPKPEAVKGPGAPKLDNAMTQRLAKIGLTPAAWTKGLDGKVLASQNAPTIAQAADTTRILDADINLFESLAAANGGKLPQKGAINVPDFLVPKLSQLGIEAGMGAEQVYQLLDGYINKQARSYGGAITDSDRDSAKRETGSSTEGLRFYLKRLRDTNNRAIRTALSQQFPGAGNEVFQLLLEDSAANEGVPEVKATPMEKKNGPPVSSKADGAKPAGKTPARSVESITGIDDRDEDERKRRARINSDAERQARRQRLERFLQ